MPNNSFARRTHTLAPLCECQNNMTWRTYLRNATHYQLFSALPRLCENLFLSYVGRDKFFSFPAFVWQCLQRALCRPTPVVLVLSISYVKILRVTTGIMPFALWASIAVQFVPDKLVAQDDREMLLQHLSVTLSAYYSHREHHASSPGAAFRCLKKHRVSRTGVYGMY